MGRRRVAVLGCGSWGRNIVRCMHELGALRAVVDPSPGGRRKAQEIAPGVATCERAAEVLADDDVDAVMIATPAVTHYRLARSALDAGKDVFVEKPMTIGVDDARELVRRADDADRILMVGHLLEYHPAVRRLESLVDGGELGEIRYLISNRLNLGKVRTEESALWSFAPHDLAVILRLVGSMPTEVVATGGCYLQEHIADVTVTQLRFPDGVRSHIFVSWLHPFKEQRLVVIGSRKMASFDDVAKEVVLYDQRIDFDSTNGVPVPVRGEGVRVSYPDDEPLLAECRHFLECLDTRSTPRTDGASGVRVLEILHAAQRSLSADGMPAALPEPALAEIETLGIPAKTAPVSHAAL